MKLEDKDAELVLLNTEGVRVRLVFDKEDPKSLQVAARLRDHFLFGMFKDSTEYWTR